MAAFILNRRRFIQISTAASGGLLIGVSVGCSSAEENIGSTTLNAFVEISPDDIVTIYAPVPEIGQGVRTAIPMLLAEELDIDWRVVRIKQAPGGNQYGPRQVAAGSVSVAVYWEPMRRAGATARSMLVAVAAKRWDVNADDCKTAAGQVIHPNSNRKFKYGDLVEEAVMLPAPEEVELKSPADYFLIGTPIKNVDSEDIVTGKPIFGLDVERPNMLRAVIARCPVYGGRIKTYDDTAALKISGVVTTVKIEIVGSSHDRPYVDEGIAIVAHSTWAAMQGRDALVVKWDNGPNSDESTDRLYQICRDLLEKPGDEVRNDGDITDGFATAKTTIEATYHIPFIAHVCMEPMNCTAEVTPDKCELWEPTQSPGNDRNAFARELELPIEAVTVNSMRCGGGFGRRVGPEDFAYEAVQIAKVVGKPVQVVWSREDDIRHDAYRAFSYHRLSGGLDENGDVTTWRHHQTGTSRYAFRSNRNPGDSEFFLKNFPGGLISNYRLEYSLAQSNLPRTILRAPGNNALSFVVESFIDELADAAKRDPLEFRLSLLGDDREFPFDDSYPVISTARMKNILRMAAEGAGWDAPLEASRGRGIASHFTFGTYVAYVVDVTVDPTSGNYSVDRVVGAIDCGRAVNPLGIRAQVEGGINDALHAARHGEITVTDGAVNQSNFHDYPLARMNEAAKNIDVHIVESNEEPMGVGEPPYPPMIPALANALFSATGKRVRKLPIRPEELCLV